MKQYVKMFEEYSQTQFVNNINEDYNGSLVYHIGFSGKLYSVLYDLIADLKTKIPGYKVEYLQGSHFEIKDMYYSIYSEKNLSSHFKNSFKGEDITNFKKSLDSYPIILISNESVTIPFSITKVVGKYYNFDTYFNGLSLFTRFGWDIIFVKARALINLDKDGIKSSIDTIFEEESDYIQYVLSVLYLSFIFKININNRLVNKTLGTSLFEDDKSSLSLSTVKYLTKVKNKEIDISDFLENESEKTKYYAALNLYLD